MNPPPTGTPARIRLGDLLVRAGVISESQLNTALKEQQQWGGKLGDILVRMQYLTEDIFVRALSKQLRMERADLSRPIPLDALARLPARLAEQYEVVPVAVTDGGRTLVVATSDPLNVTMLDALRSLTGLRIVPQVAAPGQIRQTTTRIYRTDSLPEADEQAMEVTTNTGEVLTPRPIPVFQPAPARPPAPAPPPPQATGAREPTNETQRQSIALKALVELLVQKGVISLDEYLARLPKS